MSEFTIEVMVGKENRIVQVESPKGDNYVELVSLSGIDPSGISEEMLRKMIEYCTDIELDDYRKMGPRAITKTLNACGYAMTEDSPDSEEELLPEEFGEFDIENLL